MPPAIISAPPHPAAQPPLLCLPCARRRGFHPRLSASQQAVPGGKGRAARETAKGLFFSLPSALAAGIHAVFLVRTGGMRQVTPFLASASSNIRRIAGSSFSYSI